MARGRVLKIALNFKPSAERSALYCMLFTARPLV